MSTKAPVANTAHYTPPDMARELAEGAIRPLLDAGVPVRLIRVLDPSCGEGALLLAAHDVLTEAAYSYRWSALPGENRPLPALESGISRDDVAREVARNCLVGIDLDESATTRAHEAFDERGCYDLCTLLTGDPIITDFGPEVLDWLGDVNCVVMNPPYLSGNSVGRTFGREYQKQLKELYPGSHGNADLSAYFLRLAAHVCEERSVATMAVVATNTIAQGDTRDTGLSVVLDHNAGWNVRWASGNVKWPGAASVVVRKFVLSKGLPMRYPQPPLWATVRLHRVPQTEFDPDYQPFIRKQRVVDAWARVAELRDLEFSKAQEPMQRSLFQEAAE